MISYAVIKGNNATAVAEYLSAVNTAEYYDNGGKLFETYDERIGEIIAKNNLQTDAQKIEFFRGSKRLGLDMTYSFNKDISLLALLFDKEVLETIRENIKGLIERVNNEFLETRAYDENGNRIKVPAKGLILTYEHHTSRNLDPQLHYHNFIANKVIRESDGKLTSLEATKLFENTHLLRIETNYRLAYELQRKHGYDAYLDKNGDLRVINDDELIEKFSKRKAQIAEKAKELFGTDNLENLSREQVKKLVMATRPTKKNENIETLKDLWKAELADLGYTEEVFLERSKLKRDREIYHHTMDRAFKLAVQHLDRYKGIFKKDDLYRNYLINISAISREENATLPDLERAKRLFELFIEEYDLVPLRDINGREYLATREYIETEQKSLEIFKELATTGQPLFFERDIEQVIGEYEREKGFKLSKDQRKAIFTINRTQAVLINGHAGAGKTTAMEVLKRLADKYGYKVIGLAPSGKASEELSKTLGTGLTIHSFLLNQKLIESLDEDTILVIDEAGMVDTRRIYELLKLAREKGAKIILQGDYKQIKPVEAGDFFTDAVSLAKKNPEIGYAELTEIRRQKRKEYKELTKALSDLDFERAFKKLIDRKEEFFADFDFEKLKEEFLADPNNSLIVATSNALKDELNTAIREELKRKNLLGKGVKTKTLIPFEVRYIDDLKEGDEIKINRKRYKVVKVDTKQMRVIAKELKNGVDFPGNNTLKEFSFSELFGKNALRKRTIELAVGDRVITLKNDKELEVKNGELFRVVEIKEDGTLILVNDRKRVKINPKKYPYLDYAYAITIHKSQGMTVKNVLIADRDNRMNRNLFYVAATRGKENLKIFTNDIVQTLYNAQISQAKITSFSLNRKKEEKTLTRSQIAEMLILKEPSLLEKYRKYIDNWREFNEKLQKTTIPFFWQGKDTTEKQAVLSPFKTDLPKKPPLQVEVQNAQEEEEMRKNARTLRREIELPELLNFFGIPYYQSVRRDGKPYLLARVPWREDRNPSFYAIKGDEGYWRWYDLSKKESGTIIDFVIRYKGLDFVQTLDFLSQNLEKIKKAKPVGSLVKAKTIKLQNLRNPEDDEIALKWFKEAWKLNRFPSNLKVADLIVEEEKVKENPKGFAELKVIRKEYPNPVMVWIDENGKPIYWRDLNPAKRNKGFLQSNQPRLIKAPTTYIYIVEGFTDYLTAYQIDPQANFLILGTVENTGKVIPLLKQVSDNYRIFLLLDNDKAGRQATEKILQAIPQAEDLSYLYADYKDICDAWIDTDGKIAEEFKQTQSVSEKKVLKPLKLDKETETETESDRKHTYSNALRTFINTFRILKENDIDIEIFAEMAEEDGWLSKKKVMELYNYLRNGDLHIFPKEFKKAYKRYGFTAVDITYTFKRVIKHHEELKRRQEEQKQEHTPDYPQRFPYQNPNSGGGFKPGR